MNKKYFCRKDPINYSNDYNMTDLMENIDGILSYFKLSASLLRSIREQRSFKFVVDS